MHSRDEGSSKTESMNRTYHVAQSNMEMLPNYYRWTYGKFSDVLKGRVLELGCGSGIGIQFYINNASHVYAVDYNEELLSRVRRSLPGDKVSTIQADLIRDWSSLQDISPDTVVMMDVLEHFSDDQHFIHKLRSIMQPGGYVAVKVPAQKRLFSTIDEASGHYRRYDESDLVRLFCEAGFELVRLRHLNSIGALVYKKKRKNKSNFSGTFTPVQLQFINKLMLLVSIVDKWVPLPGLSLVGVFKLPE